MTRPGLTIEERFWLHVDKTGACWTWTGATYGPRTHKYGHMNIEGRMTGSHRISYEIAHGPIPQGMVIDHKCRQPLCVRPTHLQAVTHKQNMENQGVQPKSTSGIRGVSWKKASQKWAVYVRHNQRTHYAGLFVDIKEAESAAIALRNELHTNNLQDRSAA